MRGQSAVMAGALGISGASSKENWDRFIDSIGNLNEFVSPSVLLRYQLNILNEGRFSVSSPLSGEPVEVTRSVVVGRHVAYSIPDSSGTWLVASYVGRGYPLCHVVASSGCFSLFKINKYRRDLDETEIQLLGNICEAWPPPDGRVTLHIGHKNFAHHMWNELSALNEWLQGASSERLATLSIFASDEPLGPLRELFPELSLIRFLTEADCKTPTGAPAGSISLRVGCQIVTKAVRRRVCEWMERYSRAAPDPPAHRLLSDGWPRIWVSVRTGWRTADNFEDFFLATVQSIFNVYPKAVILLDGFSPPPGFLEDPRTLGHRENFIARAGEVGNLIAKLEKRANESLGANASSRICSVSGLDLPIAITLAGRCDYYICHHGTLQHKIGWFHDIPGILHGPGSGSRTARWHAAQVEDAVVPDAFPDALIVTAEASGRRTPWNFDYSFANVELAVAFLMESMKKRLTPHASGSARCVRPDSSPTAKSR